MKCSTLHRWRHLALAGGTLLAAVDCTRSVLPSSLVTGDSLAATTHVKPIPQSGDERVTRTPPADSLGGAYSKARPGINTYAKTSEAPVRLDASVSDAVLSTYLDALNFDGARDNGELAFVRCHSGGAAGCVASLYIQPEIGMKRRSATDVPPNGMVVARVINYSTTETDTTYQIPPLTRAYWYVDSVPGGVRSRLFIHTPTSTSKLTFLSPTKTYEPCMHDPYAGPAIAKFRKCAGVYETSATRGDAIYGRAPNPFVRAVSFGRTTPSPTRFSIGPDVEGLLTTELWVKCAQGCCIAGP